MTSAFSWQNSAFDLLRFVLQSQICLLLQVTLDFLLFIPVPYNEKNIFFGGGVLVLEGIVGLHRTVQLLQPKNAKEC